MVLRFASIFFFLLISVCFPVRSLTSGNAGKERTLAMIKPDGVSGNHTEKIKEAILESGFGIAKEIVTSFNEDSASRFYAEHSLKKFFVSLIKYITRGQVLVMVLEKENAVADWRSLMGPTDAQEAKISHPNSIRAMCGLNIEQNCVHGSDSLQSARREIAFFFGDMSSGSVNFSILNYISGLIVGYIRTQVLPFLLVTELLCRDITMGPWF
ncbi:hypothetical protein K2173_009422 [Erythroxylum novogranatense]|uniref:Nucleoside diphosphate kinase n=1 Tax=Erythroxylum novogranatense TaxID=1862640 RepID=A0AAV8U3X6_9ROSI|nr:hypothetical protein K2173_009422 [Erythroxylum novogranatense]